MNILLTNDDGYNALGLRVIKDKLSKYGRVVVCAPMRGQSASSVKITIGEPGELKEIEKDVYAFDAYPADCAAFGLSHLGIDFDLVVSGCNHGPNVSYDVVYSGTIGACIQALTFRKPCIAFSCNNNFEIIDKCFDDVMSFIFDNDLLSDQYLLNVNFPMGHKVKRIELGSLYYRNVQTYYEKKADGYYAFRDLSKDKDIPPHTDCYQIGHDIVSIVPLEATFFNTALLKKVKKKLK